MVAFFLSVLLIIERLSSIFTYRHRFFFIYLPWHLLSFVNTSFFEFFLELLAQLVTGSDKFSSCLSSWLLLMPKLKLPPTTGGVIDLLTSLVSRSPAHLARLTAHKKLLKLLLRVLLNHITSLKEADTPGGQEAILTACNSLLSQLMPAVLASSKLTQALADFYTAEREALAAAVAGRGFQAGVADILNPEFFAPDFPFWSVPVRHRYRYLEENVLVKIVDFVLFPIKYNKKI